MSAGTTTDDQFGKLHEWTPTLLRFALGVIFIVNGAGKVLNIGPEAVGVDGFAGFLASLSVPAPMLFAWVIGILELVGGLMLVLGVFTRTIAVLMTINMLVALVVVHAPYGFDITNGNGSGGIEYALLLVFASAALVFSGPGRLSLERAIGGREHLPSYFTA